MSKCRRPPVLDRRRSPEIRPGSSPVVPQVSHETAVVRAKMEAMRSFESRLADDPHDAEALEKLGMLQLEVGYSHDAMSSFERLVEMSPMDAAARFWLSRALDSVGRTGDARIERQIGERLLVQEGPASEAESGPRTVAGVSPPSPAEGGKTAAPSALKKGSRTAQVDAGDSKTTPIGWEEVLLLVACLGILVIFVNILVRL